LLTLKFAYFKNSKNKKCTADKITTTIATVVRDKTVTVKTTDSIKINNNNNKMIMRCMVKIWRKNTHTRINSIELMDLKIIETVSSLSEIETISSLSEIETISSLSEIETISSLSKIDGNPNTNLIIKWKTVSYERKC